MLRTKLILSLLLLPAAALADATADATPAEATRAEALPYLEQLPPVLDRQLFFGDPEITNSQISPDGSFLSFTKPFEGVMNVWIKGIGETWDAARPMTADDRPVAGYFWSEDSKWLLYVQDKGGNENFHVYAVNPTAEAEQDTGVPPARDLTPLDGCAPSSTPCPRQRQDRS